MASCQRAAVKYLPLLAFLLLGGCESQLPADKTHTKYTRLTVTDSRGEFTAEWVAEGRVKKTDQGYDIDAVERKSAPPFPQTIHYPNRNPSSVTGVNIILEEIEKPDWLKKLDAENSSEAAHSR